MFYLLIVSLLWAFSFGLIKENLTGLDSNFVSFARLLISFLVFAPFLKIKNIPKDVVIKFTITGLVQFGLMYISYIYSFQFLKAYEVALFTIFTPIYVTLINDVLHKKFHKLFLITALLSVVGTAIIKYSEISGNVLNGFLFVQISNLSFAFGQTYYKRLKEKTPNLKDSNIFGYLLLGGGLLAGFFSIFSTDWHSLSVSADQIWTLIYLGVVASGIGFFLWNYGATKTDAGALAIFNNLKIPLAIVVSIIFFGEETNFVRLIAGGIIIIAALFLNEYYKSRIDKE